MNQNNNYNFDPMTGQPIQQSNLNQNVNLQQNYQQPMLTPNNSNNKKPMNSKAIIVVIVIVLLLAIGGGIFYFVTRDKKLDKSEVENSTNQTLENEEQNNTNQSTENENKNNTNFNNNTSEYVDPNTNTTYDENGAFLMAVEDVYTVSGKGTEILGNISRGTVKVGDTIQIIGLDKEIQTTVVDGIQTYNKELTEAVIGDRVEILLRGIAREDVEKGQVLAKPNSIIASKKFEANVQTFKTEDGGRNTPFFTNFSPQFYFRTIDVNGKITLPENIEKVNPGDNVKLNVELVSAIAMEVGTEFSIKEGNRTIGTGKITKVLN